MDLNAHQEELIKQVQEAAAQSGNKPKEQVLIEDATMSSFGFVNKAEVETGR